MAVASAGPYASLHAPHSRQITTSAPHHSVFLQARCPSCRPTMSKHWMHNSQDKEVLNSKTSCMWSDLPCTKRSLVGAILRGWQCSLWGCSTARWLPLVIQKLQQTLSSYQHEVEQSLFYLTNSIKYFIQMQSQAIQIIQSNYNIILQKLNKSVLWSNIDTKNINMKMMQCKIPDNAVLYKISNQVVLPSESRCWCANHP